MRIDRNLAEKFASRTKAVDAIKKGLIKVNGKEVQPSYEIKEGDDIEILQAEEHFVSKGGYKLSKAIKDFSFNARGKIFVDIGASNGGFTDCLLQNGAEKVYCVDVGESQLDKSLRNQNVVIIDNFNARNLNINLFEDKPDAVVIDVSFISLTYILKAVSDILCAGGEVIALIKPQFECESKKVGKNGIVKGADTHKKIIRKIYDFARTCSLSAINLTDAPDVDSRKNREYLIYLVKCGAPEEAFDDLLKRVSL